MGQFDIKKTEEGDTLVLDLVGQIDEDTDFAPCDISGAKNLKMNLEGVKSINSCGIREWIKWLDQSQSAESVEFHKCPKIIIDQMNMVEGFLPKNAKVMSFFVPYYSEETGNEKDVLFTRGKEFDDSGVRAPDEYKDEESGDVLELDVIEAKYFKFIK